MNDKCSNKANSESSSSVLKKSVSTDSPASNTRRKMVTRSLVGGGTLIGLEAAGWIKPVVDTVIVPAHAQTSGAPAPGNTRFDFSGAPVNYSMPDGVSSVRVIAAGGGGGGGGYNGGGKYATPELLAGAEGERLETVLENLDPAGETLSIVIGAGGAAGGYGDPSTYGAGGYGYASGANAVATPGYMNIGGGGGGSSSVVATAGTIHASGGGGGGSYQSVGGTGGGPAGGAGGEYYGSSAQTGGSGGGGAGGAPNDYSNAGYADSNGSPGYVIISWPP